MSSSDKRFEKLKKIGKGLLIVGVVAGAAISAIRNNTSSEDEDDEFKYFPEDGDDGFRCAHCGNTDSDTLWDEGDTIYCSKCTHRTRVDNGDDDLVECPYCHRMRDRKAMYCRWCNDSSGEESTEEEFSEIDKILKDMNC